MDRIKSVKKYLIPGAALLVCVVIVLVIILQPSKNTVKEEYSFWRQSAPEWNQSPAWPKEKYPDATEEYMSGGGCLVVSIAMLLRHYGVITDSDADSFNPWICNEDLKAAGVFDRAADLAYPQKIEAAYPAFQFEGIDTTYSFTKLKSLYDQGFACILEVNGTGGYHHYIAVKNVSDTKVTVMDPGWGRTDLDEFSHVYSIWYFRALDKGVS